MRARLLSVGGHGRGQRFGFVARLLSVCGRGCGARFGLAGELAVGLAVAVVRVVIV